MKKILALFICCLMLFSFTACGEKNENITENYNKKSESVSENSNQSEVSVSEEISKKSVVRIAAASNLSEILNYLAPEFEKQTGYSIQADFASVGVVIGKAKSGAADLILVNSESQEEKFIEDGFASTQRLSCLYNYFVICGPKDDSAGVSQTETAAEAFKAIAKSGNPFMSIGDNSISHIKETSVWESANIDPRSESWYYSAGSNESGALSEANKKGAYIIADKSTFLSMKKSLKKLEVLKSEGADLKNSYSMIAVNAKAAVFAEAEVKINTKGAKAFIKWVRSDEAAKLIENFGKEKFDDNLFFAG